MANQNKNEMLHQSHQIISMVLKNILLITLLFSFDEFKDLIDEIKNLGINIKYGINFEPFYAISQYTYISHVHNTRAHPPSPQKRKKHTAIAINLGRGSMVGLAFVLPAINETFPFRSLIWPVKYLLGKYV